MPDRIPVFALPDRLAAKRGTPSVAADERWFGRLVEVLAAAVADTASQLDAVRRQPARRGQQAVQRDVEVRRLAARLRTIGRTGLEACLGRMVDAEGVVTSIGRVGLVDDGEPVLVDWRSPAAAPFFAATHADPMGLVRRRRYRWAAGRIVDYWDEAFVPSAVDDAAALDDESAFLASLGASRSARMRDVLGTIQADQDAIIRSSSRGALVVDGGPGTGKTVVALHRTAFLLYSDPRLARGGVLFVGPNPGYLDYVGDVLPNLGEEGVQLATLADLVPEGATARPEADPRVAALKASLADAVEVAVASYERPPVASITVDTDLGEVEVGRAEWAEAFASGGGARHNDARDEVWGELVALLAEQHADEDVPAAALARAIQRDEGLRAAFARAWPVLDPAGVVADLWSVPAFLRRVAPSLTDAEVALLQRADPRAWTDADVPLLDAARQRIGDPEAAARRRRQEAAIAAERASRDRVVAELLAAHSFDDGEGVFAMLRHSELTDVLVSDVGRSPDALAGPFAHVVVDEAQELTDAEWRMLLRRCPSRSMTIVGDRAQARHGFTATWNDRLAAAGIADARVASLTVNYRTPAEVMAVAEPVIRAAIPDANVPTSVRHGDAVRFGVVADLDGVVDAWLAEHPDGTAAVIGAGWWPPRPRVRSLSAASAKGLEFDLVVLVEPEAFGEGFTGAVDRYVAMTRATGRLVLLRG